MSLKNFVPQGDVLGTFFMERQNSMTLDLLRGEEVMNVSRRQDCREDVRLTRTRPHGQRSFDLNLPLSGSAPAAIVAGSKGRRPGIGQYGLAEISLRDSDKNPVVIQSQR